MAGLGDALKNIPIIGPMLAAAPGTQLLDQLFAPKEPPKDKQDIQDPKPQT